MEAVLPGDKYLPIYHRLMDALHARIAKGDWLPGDRIPSEQSLAKQFQVAPGTVRHAITKLVGNGILERQQGRGTFVRVPAFTSSLFRFFRLEGPSGDSLYPEAKIIIRERRQMPTAIAEKLNLPAGTDGIYLSRLRLIHQSPVLAEEIWLPHEAFKVLLTVSHSEIGPLLYPTYQKLCGQIVARATETITVKSCNEDCAHLLGLPADTAVIDIERLARTYDASPVEWRRTIGCADKFRYRTELR